MSTESTLHSLAASDADFLAQAELALAEMERQLDDVEAAADHPFGPPIDVDCAALRYADEYGHAEWAVLRRGQDGWAATVAAVTLRHASYEDALQVSEQRARIALRRAADERARQHAQREDALLRQLVRDEAEDRGEAVRIPW